MEKHQQITSSANHQINSGHRTPAFAALAASKHGYGRQLSAPRGLSAYSSHYLPALCQLASNTLILVTLLFVISGLKAQNLDLSFAKQGIGKYSPSNNSELIDLCKGNNDSLYILMNSGDFDSLGNYNQNYSLIKTNIDGTLDSNFATNGLLETDFANFDFSKAQSLIFNSQGSLMLLGYAYNFDSITIQKACLQRILSNGKVDSSFAMQGTAIIDFLELKEFPTQLREDHQGRYLLAGVSLDSNEQKSMNEMPVLARLFADGSLDSSFGGTGKILIDPVGNSPVRHLIGGYLYDALPLSNGQIMLALSYSNGSHLQAMLMLLNANGSIDQNFNNGLISINLAAGFNNQVVKLVELPDSSIAFGASIPHGSSQRDFYLGRIFLNGQYSIQRVDFNGNQDILEDLILTSNQELVAVGRSIAAANQGLSAYRSDYFAIARFSNYEDLSQLSYHLIPLDSSQQAGALALCEQSQGRLVVGGFAYGNIVESILLGIYPHQITRVGQSPPNSKIELSAFPNPADDWLNLKTDQEAWHLQIFDLQARLIFEKQLQSNSTQLSTVNWPAGTYYIKVIGENNQTTSKIWIKK